MRILVQTPRSTRSRTSLRSKKGLSILTLPTLQQHQPTKEAIKKCKICLSANFLCAWNCLQMSAGKDVREFCELLNAYKESGWTPERVNAEDAGLASLATVQACWDRT
jgi:hypothetical protein